MCENCTGGTGGVDRSLINGGTSDWPDPELTGIREKMREFAQPSAQTPTPTKTVISREGIIGRDGNDGVEIIDSAGMTIRILCDPDKINRDHFSAPTTVRGNMLMSYLRMLDQYHSPE